MWMFLGHGLYQDRKKLMNLTDTHIGGHMPSKYVSNSELSEEESDPSNIDLIRRGLTPRRKGEKPPSSTSECFIRPLNLAAVDLGNWTVMEESRSSMTTDEALALFDKMENFEELPQADAPTLREITAGEQDGAISLGKAHASLISQFDDGGLEYLTRLEQIDNPRYHYASSDPLANVLDALGKSPVNTQVLLLVLDKIREMQRSMVVTLDPHQHL